MADQSHSDTEDVEKWLGVFPTKQPEVVKQSSPTKQPEVIRQSSPTKQPQVVRQASPENQPQVIRQASPERQPSPTRQASSEKQSPPLRQASPGKQPPLARHYSGVSGVPWDAHNYFRQRYSLFFKYDDGICMTDEAWFGVTPEPVACTVAQHMADAAPSAKSIIIDCFAGVGGNTIAFASSNRWTQIFAIEKDRDTIACAKKNAKIYGVSKKITWIEGDCFEVLDGELSQLCPRAVIFASPPWGGPGYRTKQIFNLKKMEPYSLPDLLGYFRKFTQDVVLYLPRTSDLRQLAEETPDTRKTKVMHYCMDGASKALCAYFGDFVFLPEETTDVE